jgi:ABC-2 type transport system permease protein
MKAVLLIAGSNLSRSVRNRSFFVLAILAPFGITAALSSTIGSALSGTYRPDLVIADEIGGGVLDELIAGLEDAGFEDLDVVNSAAEARAMVTDGDAEAAVVFPADLMASMTDPGGEPPAVTVIARDDRRIAGSVAEAIAAQTARTFDTVRTLGALEAPADDLSGPLVVSDEEAGLRVLNDGTYFAVGMTSYFAFFAAAALMATIHRERRQSTLARMLVTPIGRFAPLVGKGLAAGLVALFSFLFLVAASTLMLGAGWGPLPGVVAIGVALCFTAVTVAMAVTSVTSTEESAGQIGAVLATAWAIFGGVFLPIPTEGALAALTRLSPFRLAMDGVGLNAGVGSTGEVLLTAVGIAAFGVVGAAVAYARRAQLGGV